MLQSESLAVISVVACRVCVSSGSPFPPSSGSRFLTSHPSEGVVTVRHIAREKRPTVPEEFIVIATVYKTYASTHLHHLIHSSQMAFEKNVDGQTNICRDCNQILSQELVMQMYE